MRVSFVAIIVTITAVNYLHGAQRRDQNEQQQKMCSDFFLLLQNWNIKKKKNHVSGASSGSTVGVDVKLEPPVKRALAAVSPSGGQHVCEPSRRGEGPFKF